MAVESPPWAEQGAAGYNAEQTRRAAFFGITTPGVKTQGAWLMSAPGAMTVDNATGEGIIPGTTGSTQGDYYALATSTTTTTVTAASAVNPRIDLDCGTVGDAAYAGGVNNWAFQVVAGTPTAGATLANLNGAPALPASSLLCGYILVPANAASIVAADLLDQRVMYGPPADPVIQGVSSATNAVSGTYYAANCTPGTFTVTLPTPTPNQIIGVFHNGTANAVVVNASTNAGTIAGPGLGAGGVNAVTLYHTYDYLILQSYNGVWYPLSSGGVLANPAIFKPAGPTATASTTGVMMGLGSTISYTPQWSGNVKISINLDGWTNTASVFFHVTPKYGTGTAPANGVAATGTTFGQANALLQAPAAGAAVGIGFTAADRITGLTVGTAYWFDISLATSSAPDTAQIGYVTCLVEESL